jgi:Tol biopolymer transport system component
MTLTSGTRVGPYEIAALVGAGGMGEVYRARDTRLGRDVAIKVLPAAYSADAGRLHRFEQEARAAGVLNHPNILTVHDIGAHDGAPYIVSELLEGQTLRSRLSEGRLATRKVIDYAVQIARGLAAAHEKQIVHRDLKPENLFVTRDDRIKILDFGLAKLKDSPTRDMNSMAPTMVSGTDPGIVMGTVGYMSPEQVRGEEADHRSDIFSFGAVLYEMLGGERAFRRDTAVETMNAILKEEPPELPPNARQTAPALVRIVEHCLEKEPERRFQSTSDLAFDLETLSGLSDRLTSLPGAVVATSKRRRSIAAAIVAALALLAAGAFLGVLVGGQTANSPEVPTYRQMTFQRGTIYHAWFSADGDTIVYSASWDGRPPEIFSMRADSVESRSLGLQNADVLGLSRTGDMALLQNLRSPFPLWWLVHHGTLARAAFAGGAPREILEDVLEADWSPDSGAMAVTRYVDGRTRLEYPSGKVLYETAGYVTSPRISPSGDRVAFLDHQIQGDDRGWMAIVDLNDGRMERLTGEWSGSQGLAWRPDEKEIWIAAAKSGGNYRIYAVTLSRTERIVASEPANLVLHDIAADGRALLTESSFISTTMILAPGEDRERDLSVLDFSTARDLSADGTRAIYVNGGESSGLNYTTYLRKTDGSPPVPLGEGNGLCISPDGKWVLTYLFTEKQLILLPTGAGESRRLKKQGVEEVTQAAWLPDGQRIVFVGREAGHGPRAYLQSIEDTGMPQPITPEGVTTTGLPIAVSPDGRTVVMRDSNRTLTLYPIEGGEPKILRGIERGDTIIRWADDRSLYLSNYARNKIHIYRLDVSTDRRVPFKEIPLSDPAGLLSEPSILLTPDGKSYLLNLRRNFSKLYVASGLR